MSTGASFQQVFNQSPQSYPDLSAWLKKLCFEFHEELAKHLEPAFNEFIHGRDQNTIEEKRELASWINSELHSMGLSVRCPKSRRPAIIVADVQDVDHDPAGRFRIQTRSVTGEKKRTSSSGYLKTLELMPDMQRVEPLSRQYRHNRDDSRGR